MRPLRWPVLLALVLAACATGAGVTATTIPLAAPTMVTSASASTTTVTARATTTIAVVASTVPVTVAAECGSRPEPSGTGGERPHPGPDGWGWPSMAFDAGSGVIVATLWSDGDRTSSETWIFDVCTNVWRRGADVPIEVRRLVYHPEEDLTVALGWGPRRPLRPEVGDQSGPVAWGYDVDIDRWAEVARLPATAAVELAAVDPVSGMVWAGDWDHLATLDVATGIWTPVPIEWALFEDLGLITHQDTESMAYDPAVAGFVLVTGAPVGRTWLLDPAGRVTAVDTPTLLPGFGWMPSGNEITFDGATGRVATFSNGTLMEYDALAEKWETLAEPDAYQHGSALGPLARFGGAIVYDPINRRIVLFGGSARMPDGAQEWDDVWAFDPITQNWMVLLQASMTRRLDASTGEVTVEPAGEGR